MYSVTLTWGHVAVVNKVLIVETGSSLLELDCHSQEMEIFMKVVELKELNYVVSTLPTHQLVSIAVLSILQ